MTVLEIIRTFISENLIKDHNLSINENVQLIEDGYLTSLQTIELVMFLEDRFQFEIDPELVNEENFRTLGSIAELVQSRTEVR
ncbi:MAG: acyl carrier protein [Dehalococcoidia bacterium]